MMKATRLVLLATVLALPAAAVTRTDVAYADEAPTPDPAAVAKISKFIELCVSNTDINEAGKKVVAASLVHKSKLDPTGAQLNADSLRFAFKKAFENAKLYEPKITRVVLTGTTAVGFKETASKGKLYKYFVAKKEGVTGMPAPIQVFFPEGGGEPVLYDWGSF
jgi:hypothetical protein